MRFEDINFKFMEAFIRGILNAFKKSVVLNTKYDNDYKKRLMQRIEKNDVLMYSQILHNVKDNVNLKNIIKTLFNERIIRRYYTEKTITQIIMVSLSKKIIEKESFELGDKDFKRVVERIIKQITTLKNNKYAYQILHLDYTGPDIDFGACKLTTFDFKKEKFYLHELQKMAVPKVHPNYKNFIFVNIKGNDPSIDQPRAQQLANNFVSVLKMRFNKSPLLRLSDTYFYPLKDGWSLGYKLSEVHHWDNELKGQKEIKEFIPAFIELFKDKERTELTYTLTSSLNRYSYALTIPSNSFKLAEIIGCIETLLTQRYEARQGEEEPKIEELLPKRIYNLFNKKGDFTLIKTLIKDYYNERSEYFHQSSQKEIKKKVSSVMWLFENLAYNYALITQKHKTKKELFSILDSEKNGNPKNKSTQN